MAPCSESAPNGALTTVYSFGSVTNANGEALDGANPYAGLVQGSDGCFYGTTYTGGTNNAGTAFKICPTGALTTLYSFTGGNDGANPQAELVQGRDGNFYGTTENGGATNYNPYTYSFGYGTVFKISPTGALTSLYSFTGRNDGWAPEAGWCRAATAISMARPRRRHRLLWLRLWHRVQNQHQWGADQFVFIHRYDDGAVADAGLVQGSDGYFYGTTEGGGTYHLLWHRIQNQHQWGADEFVFIHWRQ